MLSKNLTKYIKSLQNKKYRREHRCFLVEGGKSVIELAQSALEIEVLCYTPAFLKAHPECLSWKCKQAYEVPNELLDDIGTLEHNEEALAVVAWPEWPLLPSENGVILYLDGLRDPGNLGTIIRLADWFGLTQIVVSPDCVDWHNPKVISATMGSFTRIAILEAEIKTLSESMPNTPVLVADLNGTVVHEFRFPESFILVMGSESHGPSEIARQLAQSALTIPAYGSAESLNVGVATAIMLDNWRASFNR
jgi:TrmH family RNA methyltransferase